MAGLGFKDFAVGEVLTSADVDGYLMQQSVMRFADAGARGSALGTATGTGVALAEGMVAYLDDVNRVDVYTGSSWQPIGNLLQVVSTTLTDVFSSASSTYTDVTGLTVSITPQSTSHRVIVVASVAYAFQDAGAGANDEGRITIARDGTNLSVPTSPGSRTPAFVAMAGSTPNSEIKVAGITYVDSPNTTSSVTYAVRVENDSGTTFINRGRVDTDAADISRTVSSITVYEVP